MRQAGFLKHQSSYLKNPFTYTDQNPVMLLRACAFAGLVEANLNECTITAIKSRSWRVSVIPLAVVREELMGMLGMRKPSYCINAMRDLGILSYLIPELYNCIGVTQNRYHTHPVYEHCLAAMDAVSPKYPLLRLAALLHDIGKPDCKKLNEQNDYSFIMHEAYGATKVQKIASRFKFSTADAAYITEVVRKHMFFLEHEARDSRYRKFMSELKVPIRDMIRMRIADGAGKGRRRVTTDVKTIVKRIRRIEKEDSCLKLSDLALSGHDVMSVLKLESGPAVGRILRALFDRVLEKPELNNWDDLINLLSTQELMSLRNDGGTEIVKKLE